MSGVTPQSTTSGLAGGVPKEIERTGSSGLPGMFPETPAAETSGFNIGSHSKDADDAQQSYGVAPLPATEGIGNPIQTKPGEKVPDPSSFTNNTINTAVTTDKESYERGPPQLPNVVTPQKEREAKGGGMFGLLPESLRNLIPESSLPMGMGGRSSTAEKDPGVTIQSAGPQTSTAELAGKVPLESSGVPEVVKESQQEAGFAPEASANKEAVQEKSAMEQELASKVPEEPAVAEGTSHDNGGTTDKQDLSEGDIAGMAAGGAGATAAVAAAAGYESTGHSSGGATHALPPSIQQSIDEMNKGMSSTAISSSVPDVVQESIAQAHVAPEAAASSEMVQDKSAMESELLQKVPTETMGGEQAPSASTALPSSSTTMPTSESATHTSGTAIDSSVPDVVQESIAQAHTSPEAAASSKMVQEKSAVEAELLKKVPTETMGGEPAPATSAALTESAPAPTITTTEPAAAMKSTEKPLPDPMATTTGLAAPASAPAMSALSKPEVDSRDVSPMTHGPEYFNNEPVVTTGVGSSTTAATSVAPSSSVAATPESKASPIGKGESSSGGDKKSKRKSGFFGKLKEKFHHKDHT